MRRVGSEEGSDVMAAKFVPPPSLVESDSVEFSSSQRNERPHDAEGQREQFFSSLLSGSELNMPQIRRYARKGIPEKLRPIFWKILLGYLPQHPKDWDIFLREKRAHYRQFVADCNQLTASGNIDIESRNEDVHRIDVDIPRTMPSLHFFACEETQVREGIPTVFSPNQESLRRVLHTMAKLNIGIGYVQGMNELVGHLFFTFSKERVRLEPMDVEADVFFCFQGLLTHIADNFCRVLDFDRTKGVSQTIENYKRLLEFCDPELSAHLEQQDVKPEFYAFRWVTLLLSQEFLVPDVIRLWDYLFSFCEDVNAAVYFTAVAMAIHVREQLLTMQFGPMLMLLQQYPPTDIADIIALTQMLMDSYGLDAVNQVMHPQYKTRAQLQEEEEATHSPIAEEIKEKVGQVSTKVKGFFARLRKKDDGSSVVLSGSSSSM